MSVLGESHTAPRCSLATNCALDIVSFAAEPALRAICPLLPLDYYFSFRAFIMASSGSGCGITNLVYQGELMRWAAAYRSRCCGTLHLTMSVHSMRGVTTLVELHGVKL